MALLSKSKKLHWTYHAHEKMRHYKLSESRVKRVMRFPERVEEGIAEDTIAFMQPTSLKTSGKEGKTWTSEIWVMVEETKNERKIVSAWRYPGMTKERDSIPASILREMQRLM